MDTNKEIKQSGRWSITQHPFWMALPQNIQESLLLHQNEEDSLVLEKVVNFLVMHAAQTGGFLGNTYMYLQEIWAARHAIARHGPNIAAYLGMFEHAMLYFTPDQAAQLLDWRAKSELSHEEFQFLTPEDASLFQEGDMVFYLPHQEVKAQGDVDRVFGETEFVSRRECVVHSEKRELTVLSQKVDLHSGRKITAWFILMPCNF